MPDLARVLEGVFSGGDMTIFKATVDEIGTGVVTVHSSGGTFTDVPWLSGGFYPADGPDIGMICYVIGREGWGMLVIGSPAPGPARSVADPVVTEFPPDSLWRWNTGTSWTAATGDEVSISAGDVSSLAVFIFDFENDLPPMPGTALSSAAFFLDMPSFDTGGGPATRNFLEIGLHSRYTPSGEFTALANLNTTVQTYAGFSEYVSIPLDWAGRLITGAAAGIYVKALDYPCVVRGPGTVRMTSL